MFLPTISIPETDGKSETEIKDILAIYIMAFGGLNYQITIKALSNIMLDEKKMERFSKAPIPTLVRESTNLTQFTEKEKQKYKDSLEVVYTVDRWSRMMRAWNKANTTIAVPEKDRPFTPLEEDYHIYSLMGYEEYWYWKDKAAGLNPEKPIHMTYNPKTRKNDYNEVLDGFEDIGD